MEIAGYDLYVGCVDVVATLARVARHLTGVWPEGFVGDDTPGFTIGLGYPNVFATFFPVKPDDVLFVYRSWAAYRAWDELGWTPEHAEDMVMITIEADGLTVTTETREQATALRAAIEGTT